MQLSLQLHTVQWFQVSLGRRDKAVLKGIKADLRLYEMGSIFVESDGLNLTQWLLTQSNGQLLLISWGLIINMMIYNFILMSMEIY